MVSKSSNYLALFGLACFAAADAGAGTVIAFGSSVGATNLTSAGAEMGDGFVFQLGTFEKGFVPAADNTGDWLGTWRPASDREGDSLEGNTANYRTQLLGGAFPPDLRANSFSSSVHLDHNEPPFDLGGQLYIWGYDQRANPGAAEWILITDPSWVWPDGSGIHPATSYTVSNAAQVVVGEINGRWLRDEIRPPSRCQSRRQAFYEGWLAADISALRRCSATSPWRSCDLGRCVRTRTKTG